MWWRYLHVAVLLCVQRTTRIICACAGGYYIKAAQTMVGTGFLPDEYSDEYEILLDRVPPRKFEVIQGLFFENA